MNPSAAAKNAANHYKKLKKFAENPERSAAVREETQGLMKLLKEEFS